MTLLYFSWVRQKLGKGQEEFCLPEGCETVADLVCYLEKQSPAYADVFAQRDRLRTAVNQTHVPFDAPVGPDDEVAFFPPVTGG